MLLSYKPLHLEAQQHLQEEGCVVDIIIMENYSQWHTERAPTSKKVNSVEEIYSLSEKVDALVKLVAIRSAPIDLNDMPFSTLIEKNSDAIDVNFIL